MTSWMRSHRVALVTATCMFAVMAMMMAEALLASDEGLLGVGSVGASSVAVWVWRAGGLVTWPVFMFLLLRPHMGDGGENPTGTVAGICAVAALYGGGGLWVITKLIELLTQVVEGVGAFLSPLIAALLVVVPYLYVWGFVAMYGYGRQRLLGSADTGWAKTSAIGSVVGVYGIGALIYLALAVVAVPLFLITVPALSMASSTLAEHVVVDVIAAAISTGNFCSQWWGFARVDEHFERGVAQPFVPLQAGVPQPMPVPPVGAVPQAPIPQTPVPQATNPAQAMGITQQATSPAQAMGMTWQATSPAPMAGSMQAEPRLVCSRCGCDLQVDRSQYPARVLPLARFCPSCGVRVRE